MSKERDIQETRAFFEGWELYQTIIARNYMFHAEVIEHEEALLARLGKEKLSIIELGCGDAYAIGKVAKAISVAKYHGIDITRLALEYARKNLEGVISNVELVEGEMFSETVGKSRIYDVAILGYTAHHLERNDKVILFQSLEQQLTADGLLIVYDLVREEGEAREAFLERSIQFFEASWDAFDEEKLASIRDHVSQKDYPESWKGWESIARKSGYEKAELRFRDPQNIFGIMAFSKA